MENPLIVKKIVSGGTRPVTFTDGTKVRFHYCTMKCDDDKTVIDDSRRTDTPMELIIGKKFKLEVWETAIQTMALNEISSFTVDSSLLQAYPLVSMTLRDPNNWKKRKRFHCCATSFQNYSAGFDDDLIALMKEPCNLEFILHLLSVESPDEYEKEMWQMDDGEMLRAVPELKNEGNKLYHNKEYEKASKKYGTAIAMLEQLMMKEKPNDKEWNELNNAKLLILLNYAQCKLIEKEYYLVLEHCTTVLESDPNNVKGLFRRGKAHAALWNFREAEEDFNQVAELDPTLQKLVQKELKELKQSKRQKDAEDREKYLGKNVF